MHKRTCQTCGGKGFIYSGVSSTGVRGIMAKPLAQVVEELPAAFPPTRVKLRKVARKSYTGNFYARLPILTNISLTGRVVTVKAAFNNPRIGWLRTILKRQGYQHTETQETIDGKDFIVFRGLK